MVTNPHEFSFCLHMFKLGHLGFFIYVWPFASLIHFSQLKLRYCHWKLFRFMKFDLIFKILVYINLFSSLFKFKVLKTCWKSQLAFIKNIYPLLGRVWHFFSIGSGESRYVAWIHNMVLSCAWLRVIWDYVIIFIIEIRVFSKIFPACIYQSNDHNIWIWWNFSNVFVNIDSFAISSNNIWVSPSHTPMSTVVYKHHFREIWVCHGTFSFDFFKTTFNFLFTLIWFLNDYAIIVFIVEYRILWFYKF